MARPLYSLVISLYNEERQAAFVIQRLLDYFQEKNLDFELILVNNGSRDSTEEIIASFARANPRVRKITLPENSGFGGGTFSGLQLAQGTYIGFTTAGGQVLPEHIVQVFEAAREHPNAVCKAKRLSRENMLRRLAGFGYSFLANMLFPIWTADVNGHPLVLGKETFNALRVQSKNLMINLEILVKAKQRGLKIVQVPTPYHQRAGGKSHVRSGTVWLFLKQLIELRMKLPLGA